MLTRCRFKSILTIAVILSCWIMAGHVEANVILTDSKLTFADGVKQAKQTGKPLIVLGTNPGCHNCHGVKKAIDSSPELRLVLGQYVAVEIPSSSRESSMLIDKTSPPGQKVGGFMTPLIIIFTAKGDTAFAGHVTPLTSMSVDGCKEVLIEGLRKNGGLRNHAKPSGTNMSSDIAKAQKLLKDGQILGAGQAISKYVASDSKAASDELAELIKITKLEVAKSKSDEQLASLVTELSEKAGPMIDTVAGKVKTDDPTKVAVQLAAVERAFGSYPKFTLKFESTWKELLEKSNIENLKEQAKLVDDARQLEAGTDAKKTIEAYELVSKAYPKSKAAELAQMRIKQLKDKK